MVELPPTEAERSLWISVTDMRQTDDIEIHISINADLLRFVLDVLQKIKEAATVRRQQQSTTAQHELCVLYLTDTRASISISISLYLVSCAKIFAL